MTDHRSPAHNNPGDHDHATAADTPIPTEHSGEATDDTTAWLSTPVWTEDHWLPGSPMAHAGPRQHDHVPADSPPGHRSELDSPPPPGTATRRTPPDHSDRGLPLVGLFSRDLIGPGPGVWPWGRKARQRRARREEITLLVRRRHRRLRDRFDDQQHNHGRLPLQWRSQPRKPVRWVAIGMLATVALVAVYALWMADRPSSSGPVGILAEAGVPSIEVTPGPSSPGTTSAHPGTRPGSSPSRELRSPPEMLPSTGVAAVTPRAPAAADRPDDVVLADRPTGPATTHELATAERAVAAWMARWCPFDSRDSFGESERRARSAMTDTAWSAWNPEINERARRSWNTTVQARETARCAAPTAAVSPEAPRTAHSVIVLASTKRVISAEGAAGKYVETLTATRVVIRGADGLWRVDAATEGG